ncbi:polysaccharide pyruvyl transferase WcaK-like protein [Curtobacterium sp. PhB172]|uniref:polysaccharide pyruvyl transferase family protein n=1 Tax=Curtobacterium sp. PhB172 TaxID=2485196 RepID=UPI000F4C17D2|nr:polysaccharide pyruvyl transferase family protein [Curtobacterium sp. PhB172]ROS65389.1 polysaccharide pyruvyl transferase WcaK-like protein [Curtobacterium sp. PhB172]
MTRTTPRSFVYLGWQGYDNFGDDLLHETWQAALAHPLDVEAPLTARHYLRRAPRFATDRARLFGRERVVLLGGGTTVGFATWAGHAGRAQRNYRAAATIGLGLGAAASHDSYALGSQPHDWDAWRALQDFVLLGVRGPLTEHEVREHLCPTEVVGDPALLYPQLVPVVGSAHPGGRIGVGLGSDPHTRFDVETVSAAVDRYAGAHDVAEVVVFAFCPADVATARAVSARLRTPATVHTYTDVLTTMQTIAGCDLLVSERLHGVVAAVSLDVPTVPLSYASKCDDFWSSVTGLPSPITVGHDVDELVAAMEAADALRTTIRPRTAELQRRLTAVQRSLVSWRAGTTSTAELRTASEARS